MEIDAGGRPGGIACKGKRSSSRPLRVPTGLAALAVLIGCDEAPREQRAGPSFVESGAFQTYSAPDGRVLRILYDGDGDHQAEVVTHYGPEGRPAFSEIDTDRDGTVDRWEDLGPEGKATRVGSSTRTPGKADTWITLDAGGRPTSRERDEDGDGRVDHTQHLDGDRVLREEQDTDGDGRTDVWRSVGTDRVTEELDSDGNGKPDRRVVRDAAGEVIGIETDPQEQGAWAKVRVGSGKSRS